MRIKYFLSVLLFILLTGCKKQQGNIVYESEELKIIKLTNNSYVHVTYLYSDDYGKVSCNGLIYINNNEAVVFDTPSYNNVSEELINWVENDFNSNIKAVIPTHFHVDCLGGLAAFHSRGIPSYANKKTIEMADRGISEIPENGFDNSFELTIGNEKVYCEFLGEGHTSDNSIAYIPADNILFGGCLIKEQGAGKGNLNDANIQEWSNTVTTIKKKYKNLDYVVPGHGKSGGTILLDYTINLFRQ